MSYIKKKGNKWIIWYRWKGVQYNKSLKVRDKKSAEKLQKLIDYQISTGEFDPDMFEGPRKQDKDLSFLINKYINYLGLNKKNYKPKTIENYISSINLFKSVVGNVYLNRINIGLIENKILPYYLENYSIASIRHHFININIMLNKAIEWELMPKNPLKKRIPKIEKRVPRYFKKNELEQMKTYFSNPKIPKWQGELVILTVNTGLRREEVFNLDWNKHINMIDQQLTFRGKGDRERVVPLNNVALSILQKRNRHISNSRVFWEIKTAEAINNAWQRMKQRIGIEGRFHDLRKTYASYYVMNGGSLERLQAILGHEDYKTVKIYATFSPESVHKDKNIVNLLG
jgi:site-specific recombinase XerD